jgi:hypothetical protein
MASGIFNHTLMYEPLRGGVAVQNPVVGNYGTCGCIATSDGADRWIVSCYHVLCRLNGDMPQGAEEPIFYPLDLSRLNPLAMASMQRANRAMDWAAALVLGPALGEILGIGRLSPPAAPILGMRVIKSGAETGVTEGRILRVTQSEVEIGPPGILPQYQLSEGGDSGAVWVDAATLAPVALHFKGSDWGTPERAFARPLQMVLDDLGLTLIVD